MSAVHASWHRHLVEAEGSLMRARGAVNSLPPGDPSHNLYAAILALYQQVSELLDAIHRSTT